MCSAIALRQLRNCETNSARSTVLFLHCVRFKVGGVGVIHNEPRNLVHVQVGKSAYVVAAKGVPHQNIGSGDASTMQGIWLYARSCAGGRREGCDPLDLAVLDERMDEIAEHGRVRNFQERRRYALHLKGAAAEVKSWSPASR